MTERSIVASERAPDAIGPYSQAVLCDGWLWCSGQIGLDPATMQVVEGGVVAETERVLDNLQAVLAVAGAGSKPGLIRGTQQTVAQIT